MNDLPLEVYEKIFEYMPIKDILALRVDENLKTIIDGHIVRLYSILKPKKKNPTMELMIKTLLKEPSLNVIPLLHGGPNSIFGSNIKYKSMFTYDNLKELMNAYGKCKLSIDGKTINIHFECFAMRDVLQREKTILKTLRRKGWIINITSPDGDEHQCRTTWDI